MKKLELIIEQIKYAYPDASTYRNATDKNMGLTLRIPPFGEVIIDESYNISINYSNPYSLDLKIYEYFFKSRLIIEGYQPYVYEDKIILYKRSSGTQNEFEDAIIRANSFTQTIKSIEKFIEWYKILNNNSHENI